VVSSLARCDADELTSLLLLLLVMTAAWRHRRFQRAMQSGVKVQTV